MTSRTKPPLRVLYASEREHIPDRVDGALYAAHSLLSILNRRGHPIEAVASIGKLQPARRLAYRAMRAVSARRLLALPDRRNGYPTRRSWEELIGDVVVERMSAFRPDVLLTQLDGCERVARIGIERGVPTIVWVHDNEFSLFTGNVPRSRLLLALSATDFVSQTMRARLRLPSDVLYPPVRLDRCLASRDADAGDVTFINPVKEKGLDIALEVARLLPHRRFQFVEAWPLRQDRVDVLQRALAGLPNVTFRRWSEDVRPVYARTRVLLAPSQWLEAFCTVVFEANANGIPVVASRIGGIPTTLGRGGLLVDPHAPAEEWATAVEGLMSDVSCYQRLSALALDNAAREEFNADRIVDRFIDLASAHATSGRVSDRGSSDDHSLRACLSRG